MPGKPPQPSLTQILAESPLTTLPYIEPLPPKPYKVPDSFQGLMGALGVYLPGRLAATTASAKRIRERVAHGR